MTVKQVLKTLKRDGFDKTYSNRGTIHVGCSQCESVVINGSGCHEYGCPNVTKKG